MSTKKIAVLAADYYEERELWAPYYRLQEAGATVEILGTGEPGYKGKHGMEVKVDRSVMEVDPARYDAVIIPGGYAPDRMRRDRPLLDFVRKIFERKGIVAYICHAGWVAISAGLVNGRRVTSYHSIKDDLVNAGADWVDEPVVRDGNLISSRMPADIPEFNRILVQALSL